MKKRAVLILAAVLCIIAGLAVFFSKNHVKNTDVLLNNNIDIKISAEDNGQNDSQNYWNADNHNFAKGDGGYYYFFSTGKAQYLYFFDEEAKKSIAVCNKADCQHNDETCNAYYADNQYMRNTVYFYKGNLYVVRLHEGMGILCRMNLENNGREDIAELFPSDGTGKISLVFCDDAVYAYDSIGHSYSKEENKEVIKKISLKYKTAEEIFSFTGVGGSVGYGKCFGGNLFFTARNYSLDMDTAEYTSFTQLYCYNDLNKEVTKLSDEQILDYYVDIQNERIYYFVLGKGLYRSRLDGTQAVLLKKADSELVNATVSCDGKYIYLDNAGVGSLTDARARIERYIFVLDMDGNYIKKIDCENCIGVYFGDSRYMFARFSEQQGQYRYIDKSEQGQWEWISL